MQIKFPFVYTVDAIPVGYRKSRMCYLLGWETIEFDQVTQAQAPIAIQAQVLSNSNPLAPLKPRMEENHLKDITYRMYKDTLCKQVQTSVKENYPDPKSKYNWVKITNEYRSDNLTNLNLQDYLNLWSEVVLRYRDTPKISTQVFSWDNKETIVDYITDEKKFEAKQIFNNNRNQEWSKIQTAVKNSAFIDNDFYLASEGPAYLVKLLYLAQNVHMRTLVPVPELSFIDPLKRKETVSVLDERNVQRVKDHIAEQNQTDREKIERSGRRVPNFPVEIGQVQILQTPRLPFSQTVTKHSRTLLKAVEPWVGQLTDEQIGFYTQLRNLVKKPNPFMGDTNAREILNLAIQLADCWQTHCKDKNASLDLLPILQLNDLNPLNNIKANPDYQSTDALVLSTDDMQELGLIVKM